MSQKFDLLLSVQSTMLSTVLTAIEGRADLLQLQISRGNARIGYIPSETMAAPVNTSMTPMKPLINSKTGKPFSKRWANGTKNKGILAVDLITQTLSKEINGQMRPWTFSELAQEFVNHGFARNSTSAALWKLTRAKKVRFLGDSKYCLPGATVHMGAAGTQ